MEETNQSRSYKIVLIVVLALLLIGLIVGGFFVSQRRTTSDNGGTDSSKPLATVGNKAIYPDEVKAQAEKKYGSAASNSNVIESVLDETKKRAIMDIEAANAGIHITDEELVAAAKSQFPDNYENLPETFKDAIKYTLLESKLTAKFVDSRTAYTIGFWVPPLSAKESFTAEKNATYEQQRQEGANALNEILARMQRGQEPLAIATTINRNYPVIKPILGINGFIVDGASDVYALSNPRVYTYQKQTDTKELFDTMFSANVGDIKRVDSADGAGGFVFKIVSVNKSDFKTFDEWLQSRAAALVR